MCINSNSIFILSEFLSNSKLYNEPAYICSFNNNILYIIDTLNNNNVKIKSNGSFVEILSNNEYFTSQLYDLVNLEELFYSEEINSINISLNNFTNILVFVDRTTDINDILEYYQSKKNVSDKNISKLHLLTLLENFIN